MFCNENKSEANFSKSTQDGLCNITDRVVRVFVTSVFMVVFDIVIRVDVCKVQAIFLHIESNV